MRKFFPLPSTFYLMGVFLVFSCKNEGEVYINKTLNAESVGFWLSEQSESKIFSKQAAGVDTGRVAEGAFKNIIIDTSQVFQKMDGFGFALNGGSAMHIFNMNHSSRSALLNELFGNDENSIKASYLRVSIGSSDLDEYPFSYNDLPDGQTDVEMNHFDLGYDKLYLIPVLKEIIEISPEIKIMASPWSPPAWMKTNKSTIGGSLLPEYYDAYALYFVKYIQSMLDEGIEIDAITVQNEPLHDGNNPSMHMSSSEQALFISQSLGPTFLQNQIDTKIIIYDHNADRIDYPISVLNDLSARQYIEGSAFHLYGGDINDLSALKNAHPDKNLYFTEQWVGAPGDLYGDLRWHIRNLIIGASRNWCKTIIEWNLASDENQKPHTDGGCSSCLGAVTITDNSVKRNTAYYVIAHASKFVTPGSVRVYSSSTSSLPNVSFFTPGNKIVTVVLNNSNDKINFNILLEQKSMHTSLKAGAVGTYIWDIKS
tara:strand:- start:566 stop:2014 length:1449 start_codon:yes stop_codon:yes gene_type:complete